MWFDCLDFEIWHHSDGAESHLPILGADAYMFSTLIQADLVDLHWTLWAEKKRLIEIVTG